MRFSILVLGRGVNDWGISLCRCFKQSIMIYWFLSHQSNAVKDVHSDFSKSEVWRMKKLLVGWAVACAILVSCDAILKPNLFANKVSVSVAGSFWPSYDPDEHPHYLNIDYQYNVLVYKAYDEYGVVQGLPLSFSESIPAPNCSVFFTEGNPLDEAYIIVMVNGAAQYEGTGDHGSFSLSSSSPIMQCIVRLTDCTAGTPYIETLSSDGYSVTLSFSSFF
jgi:hypothetical protein